MLLSAFHPQSSSSHSSTNLFFPQSQPQLKLPTLITPKSPKPLQFATSQTPNSIASNASQAQTSPPVPNPKLETTHLVTSCVSEENGVKMEASSAAVAAAIRRASTSPVEFVQRVESEQKSSLVLPSADFQRLCVEQLDLFRRIVDCDALISVYVRPAGSYVMDRLELRRVMVYPSVEENDIVILIGNFNIATGLRVAEAALSKQQGCGFPMVKHPFVVGFLVAELPMLEVECEGDEMTRSLTPYVKPQSLSLGTNAWDFQPMEAGSLSSYKFTVDQRLNAINIARSIVMAYVLDQKAMLLQQSSWQNNVRMSNLVEQIHGPLSSIRTLSKMLSDHLNRSEVSYDIAEDILVQGDRMKDTLEQLQDAVYLTKTNILRYNEETQKKMHGSSESARSQICDDSQKESFSRTIQDINHSRTLSSTKDLEMLMPSLTLAPFQQQGIKPCNVSDIVADLVGAVGPLARDQQRIVEFRELSLSLQVAVEEPSLRQALSNLIEGALLRTHVGGRVDIVSTSVPAAGTLVVIDDDGPDMHYMTQMHSLTPFGTELLSNNMVADNMTWNFVAGLTIAREILESYGCVIRIISPCDPSGALGAGGTRIELWLP